MKSVLIVQFQAVKISSSSSRACGAIPGKNGASAMPKQNRTATRPPKLVVPAVATEIHDHTHTQKGMDSDGRTFVKIMLLGICMRTQLWEGQPLYPSLDSLIGNANPTLKIDTATLKSFPIKPRSFSNELSHA
jgi:hypothetical protein